METILFHPMMPLAAVFSSTSLVGFILVSLVLMVLIWAIVRYGALWLQAYLSDANVSFISLIGMRFRRVNPGMIVAAQIMVKQAGWNIDSREGISTARLEAHVLAGGDVMQVVRAIISARLAGMDLDFDRAAAIDLAGRDVMEAVRISVSPKVINCPESQATGKMRLSAVAKNGIELRIRAQVTVRTNLNQLIGGATEETIIARVGQGIISTIGRATTHMDVIATPNRISQSVLERGLDANTAFEIVSIDIAQIDIGENIGARLQSDRAEADMRIARAQAEMRRAAAVAWQQEMKAQLAASHASLVLAEAELPAAIAIAFRAGQLRLPRIQGRRRDGPTDRRTGNSAFGQTSPRLSPVEQARPVTRSTKTTQE
jgi:uncharacterized protein YqfA (UPF0365 family)